MIVDLATQSKFREDILANRIEEIVQESIEGALGRSVGATELASSKHSLRHRDTVREDCQYAELPDHFTVKPGFFLAQVVGESMNRRIPNGSWCLFREPSDGSRNGKVVIVQRRDIQDPDTGGQYTVKIYRSEKAETEDSWSHRRIRLEHDSMDVNFKPLTHDPERVNDLRVVGEFVWILG